MCRQQSEVSTPNRDVWRGYVSPGANHSRCVKTERRRRAAVGHILQPKRGIAKGIRFNSLSSDVVTIAILSTQGQNVRNLRTQFILFTNPKKPDFPPKNQSEKVLILLKFLFDGF
ncbi:hypothetical protein [Gilliamella sp. Pas-s95]|uniref:hypothetical protein n=1 Tax=Gilliamella sp. Pas-s95 TaxID=2687317 RepID=UPI001320F4E7|nr:hypothetical protein [Gilliamella sp. Pas-s95]MWN06079.1 hypothetical protein [Gilliamella sp. Pas-s95]